MAEFFESLRSLLSGKKQRRAEPEETRAERELEEPLPAEVEELRQGDIANVTRLPISWIDGSYVETPLGVAIISQTCDVVRRSRAEVQVSPIVKLHGDEAGNARSGRAPRFATLPAAVDESLFVDLSVVATVHKSKILQASRQSGVDQQNFIQVADFSRAVGRRFDRFAFPDAVVSWIRPLQELLRKKAGNTGSPLFAPLDRVVELRLECIGGWKDEPPYDLVLIVVVKPGYLPPIGSVEPVIAESTKKPAEEAASMPPDGASLDDVQAFWDRFGDSLARYCRPATSAPEEHHIDVTGIVADVVSEDDLTYDRVRKSAEIDLDHLSPPIPD